MGDKTAVRIIDFEWKHDSIPDFPRSNSQASQNKQRYNDFGENLD